MFSPGAQGPHQLVSTYTKPSRPIAFFIKAASSIATDHHGIIKFNQTMLDSANAYNIRNGKYTGPKSGTYSLTWTIYVENDSHALTQLMINNSEYSRAFAGSDNVANIHTSTGIAVASLAQGDTVHVKFGNRAIN